MRGIKDKYLKSEACIHVEHTFYHPGGTKCVAMHSHALCIIVMKTLTCAHLTCGFSPCSNLACRACRNAFSIGSMTYPVIPRLTNDAGDRPGLAVPEFSHPFKHAAWIISVCFVLDTICEMPPVLDLDPEFQRGKPEVRQVPDAVPQIEALFFILERQAHRASILLLNRYPLYTVSMAFASVITLLSCTIILF